MPDLLVEPCRQERLFRYPHGVWMVPLDEMPLERGVDAASVAASLAVVLGLPERESPASDVQTAQVTAWLQPRRTLLILDGCQALTPDGVALLRTLLQRCPGMDLLVTTRRALDLPTCRTFVLNGLSYPPDERAEGVWEAVELFLVRWAQHRWASLRAEERVLIRRICRQVEGLPLAIELAAALTRDLALAELAAALERGLDILAIPSQDAPARHRSLRAAFESSCQGLSPELQARLAQLARLGQHFSLDAARQQAQVSEQELGALCERSLLIPQSQAGHYRIHAMVRAFAVPPCK